MTDSWRQIAESDDFTTLVQERRRYSFTLLGISMGWYALFLILLVFAKDFMGSAVFTEELTVAYVFGLSQFILTFFVILAYTRKADGRFSDLERRASASIEAGDGPIEPAANTPAGDGGGAWEGGPR